MPGIVVRYWRLALSLNIGLMRHSINLKDGFSCSTIIGCREIFIARDLVMLTCSPDMSVKDLRSLHMFGREVIGEVTKIWMSPTNNVHLCLDCPHP